MAGTFSITVSETRGLVAVPANLDNLICVVGCASARTGETPYYQSIPAATSGVGYGDAPDCLRQIIAQRQPTGAPQKPACFYGTATGTPGYFGALDEGGTLGSSTVSIDESSPPLGTYHARLHVVAGGTLGTAGILVRGSLDDGRNYGPLTKLSTAGTPSYGSLTSTTTAFPVALAAGDTFVGKVDEQGSATTLTVTAVAATKTGSGATYAAVTAGHTLTVTCAGTQTVITFTGSENSQATFHATINGQLSATGFASNAAGQTKLSTNQKGSGATGAVNAGDADVLASLGLTVAAFTAGTGTFPNVAIVTAAQFAAILSSTFTGGTAGSTGTANANGSVTWKTNTAGASPKGVQFTSGTGVAKIAGFDTTEHNGAATGYAFEIPNSGVRFLFTAGTLVTNQYARVRTFAPAIDADGIDAAMTDIAKSSIQEAVIVFETPMTAALAAHVSTGLDACLTRGKRLTAICRTRVRDLETSLTVTGATNATPIVVTVADTSDLTSGNQYTIAGVIGNTAANGAHAVTVINGTTFSIPVAGSGSYTSGGTVTESEEDWMANIGADFFGYDDARVHVRATYGLITDATTSNVYFRSDLAQFAADVARVPRKIWLDSPSDQSMANFSLVDSNGVLVGHDEGTLGVATGLSDGTPGGRFGCNQRIPGNGAINAVFATAPWVMYPNDGRVRLLMARRIVNALEREAVIVAIPELGAVTGYIPADPDTPGSQPQLTDVSITSIQGVVFSRLSTDFAGDIQNATDASVNDGFVQVSPYITVAAGALLGATMTLAPLLFGYLLSLDVPVTVQE